MKTVTLKNKLGKIEEVKLGFCWITLISGLLFSFLAPIPDLLKGNFKSAMLAYFALIMFGIVFITLELSTIVGGVVFIIITVVYALFRNKYLMQYYLEEGWWFLDGTKEEVDGVLGFITSESVWKYRMEIMSGNNHIIKEN